jgi:hypothetical protein
LEQVDLAKNLLLVRDVEGAKAILVPLFNEATLPQHTNIRERIDLLLGLAHCLEQKPWKAVSHFTRVLEQDPLNKHALMGIAEDFERTGLCAQALHYYSRVVAIQPAHFRAKIRMANILANHYHQYELAHYHLRQAWGDFSELSDLPFRTGGTNPQFDLLSDVIEDPYISYRQQDAVNKSEDHLFFPIKHITSVSPFLHNGKLRLQIPEFNTSVGTEVDSSPIPTAKGSSNIISSLKKTVTLAHFLRNAKQITVLSDTEISVKTQPASWEHDNLVQEFIPSARLVNLKNSLPNPTSWSYWNISELFCPSTAREPLINLQNLLAPKVCSVCGNSEPTENLAVLSKGKYRSITLQECLHCIGGKLSPAALQHTHSSSVELTHLAKLAQNLQESDLILVLGKVPTDTTTGVHDLLRLYSSNGRHTVHIHFGETFHFLADQTGMHIKHNEDRILDHLLMEIKWGS